MARIKALFMAVVLLVLSAGPALGVDYTDPRAMDLYLIPTNITGYMIWDNQTHTREYHFSGTCRFEYDTGLTAFTPEVFQLKGTATFNWVTRLFREHVEFLQGDKVLTSDAWAQGNTLLDPMLLECYLYNNASGSLYDYTPDSLGAEYVKKIWLSSPSWEKKRPIKWPNVPSDGGIMPYISCTTTHYGSYWKNRVEEQAKTLKFSNGQDQYFTKGEKILFVASQYIPDDFFVDDYQTVFTEDGKTNRPFLYYGTQAELTFQFKGEQHDTWSPVTSVRQVNMHNGAVIYSLDTSDLTPGPWEVSARIIAMDPYVAPNYPTETLRFNLVQKLSLWNGFDSSKLTLSPSIDYQNISLQAPMSKGQFTFSYDPLPLPIVGPTFKETRPLAIEADSHNLKFDLPKPGEAADLYVGFALPDKPGEIYLLYPDQTLHPLAAGLKPWKANLKQAIDEVIFDGATISALPKGLTLDVYILLTPHGDLDNYYFWKTFVTTK